MTDYTFNEFQDFTELTAKYPDCGEGTATALAYTGLGMNGEAGEYAEKIKKVLRDDDGVVTESNRPLIAKEIGDVLWYAARAAKELGYTLNEIVEMNVAKLTARHEQGKISGSGDTREVV